MDKGVYSLKFILQTMKDFYYFFHIRYGWIRIFGMEIEVFGKQIFYGMTNIL